MRRARWKRKSASAGLGGDLRRRQGMPATPAAGDATRASPWGNLRPGEVWDTVCSAFRCRWPVARMGREGIGQRNRSIRSSGRASHAERAVRGTSGTLGRIRSAERGRKRTGQSFACLAPRRGNPPSSRTATAHSESSQTRGTISRRPPCNAHCAKLRPKAARSACFARRWRLAALRMRHTPCGYGPFSFPQDGKENGGCIAQLST